ncbi:MAG: GNAT family N-acetyltransferase, partial [Patescibacteria group bacterium]
GDTKTARKIFEEYKEKYKDRYQEADTIRMASALGDFEVAKNLIEYSLANKKPFYGYREFIRLGNKESELLFDKYPDLFEKVIDKCFEDHSDCLGSGEANTIIKFIHKHPERQRIIDDSIKYYLSFLQGGYKYELANNAAIIAVEFFSDSVVLKNMIKNIAETIYTKNDQYDNSRFACVRDFLQEMTNKKPEIIRQIMLEWENTNKWPGNDLRNFAYSCYYQNLAENSLKSIDSYVDKNKKLPFEHKQNLFLKAIEFKDEESIKSLGSIITRSEKNQLLENNPDVSEKVKILLDLGRTEYRELEHIPEKKYIITNCGEALEEYINKGEVKDKPLVKLINAVLSNIKTEEATQLLINQVKKTEVDNPHLARLVKTFFEVDHIKSAKIVADLIQNEGLPAKYKKYFLTKFVLMYFPDEYQKDSKKIIDMLQENIFLFDAISENTRFGSKLLVKFPQLDELSQQNIKFLFDAKKEILAGNPEIVPESLEFRQLMQEKLKKYEDNPEILAEIKKSGVNLDQWLNYQDTRYFSLESGISNLAFSETVSTPLNRIKETIDSYAHQIKEILKEYKKELSAYQIPVENPQEIEDKIAQMRMEQEKARTEGNEKKAQGIQKGIDGLNQKLADLKTVSSWDKVLGDINAFDQLKNDVFGTQEKLIQAENEFAEKTSGKTPSGKEIQDAKQRIAKAKEELRNKFGLLEDRIENFKINLPKSTEPALGKERTDALVQEIETELAEQFDHYNVDRSTLANLFSERGDKEKDKMESLPMSIFVWARNPDIDLYQGNYSDCCIKINSDHMGAESTIADYNTDLGVQIINIWDETKNEPVTATWCWLGKNEKGETSLVVDNIESNTLYSSNYPEQLTEELFDYLKDYAKAIGVKKIVLGKSNNDLPTGGELAKLIDDKSEYEKIGGYNRVDGYFLEAEGNKVKIIWEAKQKESENKAKEKNKITAVEFTEANARDLNENDFETIKKMERKIYRGTDLIQGQAMIEDIKSGKGLDYSTIFYGKNSKTGKTEAVGYIVAVEDETDEGDESVYLEDIAVLTEAQGQGLGWNLFKSFVEKLKAKALKENKPILLDMHLRENSQRFMERHRQELEQIGVRLIEEALVADYYDEGEDALYQVYEVEGA